ncbi:hypothetical protein ACFFRR_002929 [Megaselia abdita]
MSAVLFTVALVAIIIYLVYYYFTKNFNHWKDRGVTGPQPKLFFGNFKGAITEKRNFGYEIDDIYKSYKKTDDFVGVFSATTPQLLILNPELVKKIQITDFSSFADNEASQWTDGNYDDLMISEHPFVLKGAEWKEKRAELLPSLTPAKIKSYYPVIKSVCSKLTNHIQDNEQEYKNCVDATDLLTKFTGEVMCDIVWGLQAGAFTTKDDSGFMKMSHKLVGDFFTALGRYLTSTSFPILKWFMNIQFVKKDTADFFRNLSKLAIESRMNGKERNDFLQFMINLQDKKHITHDQFVSRQLIFVFDGIDTTAVIATHILLFVARDKAIQRRLRQIISETAEEDGFMDCDVLQNLTFLDNIVNESLRIFTPVATGLSKYCTKPYHYIGDNGKALTLKPKDLVVLPTYSFHMDSDYYDEPEKFKPDRFNEENGGVKKFKDAGVFFPFGAGPRICIGMKIAIILCKAAIVELVRNFDIEVHEKTRKDNLCDPTSVIMKLDGGIHLKLKSL